jgi:hypothetical protein
MNRDGFRAFSPLTPALSPFRVEGRGEAGLRHTNINPVAGHTACAQREAVSYE